MTTAADPKIYPAPRKRAVSGESLAQINAPPAPRMRLVSFAMTMAANTRRTISTARMLGPLIVKGIVLEPEFGVAPPSGTFEVGYSTVEVTESAVALGTVRPFNVLMEVEDPFGVLTATRGRGILAASVGTVQRFYETPLDLIVSEPSVYITVSFHNVGAGAGGFYGHVRILEGVNPEALSFFL